MDTQIFEQKAIFSVKKIFWRTFSRFIECNKPQVTTYKGPKGSLTISVAEIISFLYSKGSWKQKTLKKRQPFQRKSYFGLFFSYYIEQGNRQGAPYKCSKANLNFIMEVIRSYLKDLRGWWKHKLLKKKATCPVKRKFCPFFSLYRVRQTSYDNFLRSKG